MSLSPRLQLPLLVPGQAQKELFHNEALQKLDMLVHAVCHNQPAEAPPSAPALGSIHIVGDDPVGDWVGHANALACWTEGGWRFCEPFVGLEVLLRPSNLRACFDGEKWQVGVVEAASVRVDGRQVLAQQQEAISTPEGGTVIDPQARDAVSAILRAMRSHGLIAAA